MDGAAESRVSHEQIIERVRFVGRLVGGSLAAIFAVAAALVGSCVSTRDLTLDHDTRIDATEREIIALRASDAATQDTLREIHGSVMRIEGALGIENKKP